MSRVRRAERRARSKPEPPAPPSAPRPIPRWVTWAVERGFWITLLAAVALRLAHWISVCLYDPFYAQTLKMSDMRTYWNWAEEIAGGDWLGQKTAPGPFYYGPLYAYFLAGLFRLFGESYHLVHGAQALLGILPPVLLWAVCRRVFDKGSALATGLMAAWCAPILFYEQTLLMEGLLVVINAAILWCFVRVQASPGSRAWWALASGLLSGLACWGRGNFLFVIPVLAGAWLIVPALFPPAPPPEPEASKTLPPASRLSRTRRLLRPGLPCAAAYLLGVGLLLGLTLWRNVHVGGQWAITTSNGPILLYQGNASDAEGIFLLPPSVERLKQQYGPQGTVPWMRELVRDMGRHPFAFLGLMLKKTWIFWNSYDAADNISYYACQRYCFLVRWSPVTWLTLVPLAVLGVWETRREWRRQVFLYLYAVAFALSIIVVFVVGRYRLEEMLPLLVWAGPVVTALTSRIWQRRWNAVGARTLAVAAGVALLWPIWSPAVAHNNPVSMPGRRLVRPNDYNRLAIAYIDIQRRREAREVLEEAVPQYPFIDGVVFPLAKLYMEEGRPQKAVPILQKYVRLRANDRRGALMLASALAQCGRKPEALQLIQAVLRNHPNDPDAIKLLAAVQGRP